MMRDLAPCDLGGDIEVVHDVEAVEIEMECDLEEDEPARWFDEEFASTMKFARDAGTHQFVRHSAPYERIEIQLDPSAFIRATIEEARSIGRTRS